MKKLISIFINIILVLIPFLPITENIFNDQIDKSTFSGYITTCLVIFIVMILLMLMVKKNNFKIGIILFFVGILVTIPLHLGPPREDESIFIASFIEKTRYGLLIVSVLTFYFAIFLFLKKQWKKLKTSELLIVIPLLFGLPILLWDNIDSFMFTEKIRNWIDSGKDSKTFFTEYILGNVNWYAAGRILLYISIAWFSVILMHHSFIRKWKGIAIAVFSLVGIIFCLIFLSGNTDFYFPFMIPAVVLAPAYWLGLSLINENRFK